MFGADDFMHSLFSGQLRFSALASRAKIFISEGSDRIVRGPAHSLDLLLTTLTYLFTVERSKYRLGDLKPRNTHWKSGFSLPLPT